MALLAQLYDNYVPDCTVPEKVTTQERQEESKLLDGLLATPVLSTTMNFLADKGNSTRLGCSLRRYLTQVSSK